MLTDPDIAEIVRGPRGMMRGIDSCVHQQCLMSAITLIYSTIDALSALTRPLDQPDTKSNIFVAWVDKYLLPESRLSCSSEDLYGARCGILHNYGLDSAMRRQGRAKALVYRWREGPFPDPQHRARIPADAITICVEDLHEALNTAVENFLIQIGTDVALKSRIDRHRKDLLCYRPWSAVKIRVAA